VRAVSNERHHVRRADDCDEFELDSCAWPRYDGLGRYDDGIDPDPLGEDGSVLQDLFQRLRLSSCLNHCSRRVDPVVHQAIVSSNLKCAGPILSLHGVDAGRPDDRVIDVVSSMVICVRNTVDNLVPERRKHGEQITHGSLAAVARDPWKCI